MVRIVPRERELALTEPEKRNSVGEGALNPRDAGERTINLHLNHPTA